tara:strand:+ start:4061 stop:4936 length:876 start_codon:yes stop_codon:yes gene_type:complete
MAYSSPSTQVTGYVVLAADWNEFVNNFKAMAPDVFTTNGDIYVGSAANAGTRIAAFTDSTGVLIHEIGGMEFDASAITTLGLVRGASAGVMSILAGGTALQGLRVNAGATDLEWAGIAGQLVRIGTAAASSSASLTITGLDSTYDTYYIEIADVVPADDNVALFLRLGDSGGIDSGATDYEWHTADVAVSVATYSGAASTGAAEIRISAGGVGSAAGEGAGASLVLHRPGDGSTRPILSGTRASTDNGGVLKGGFLIGERSAVITLTQVQILFASGDIASGRLTVWGLAHA